MKNLIKTGLLFTLFVQAFAFAQGSEDKYVFNELEQVDQFRNNNIKGSDILDRRTILVDVGPSQAYLLVLNRNIPGLVFSDELEILTNNNQIKSGIDRVIAHDQASASALIETIYSIPDRESRSMVRDRLVGMHD